jgi:hypothetical protein
VGEHQIRVPILDQLIEVHPVPRRLDREARVGAEPPEIAPETRRVRAELDLFENPAALIHAGDHGRCLV